MYISFNNIFGIMDELFISLFLKVFGNKFYFLIVIYKF